MLRHGASYWLWTQVQPAKAQLWAYFGSLGGGLIKVAELDLRNLWVRSHEATVVGKEIKPKAIAGPMSGIQATLTQLGWTVKNPQWWGAPSGRSFSCPLSQTFP